MRMKGVKQMWEWLMANCRHAVSAIGFNKHIITCTTEDDVIQEVMMQLFEDERLANRIYSEKNIQLLYVITKRTISTLQGRERNQSKAEYHRFRLVESVCDKYNIEPVKENAYKITALIAAEKENENDYPFNTVLAILENNQEYFAGYARRETPSSEYLE